MAFRLVQAAGAALMTPTSLGLLLATFPPARRGGAVRTWTAVGGLGAALGPMIGGVLVTFDWRWIFLVNVPVGLVALLVGWRLLPDVPGQDLKRPNAVAAALVTGGIGLVTYAIIKGNDWGWLSREVGLCVVVSALLLGLFVRHCVHSANPFIDPSLFRIRPFTGSGAGHGALLGRVRRDAAVDRALRAERVGILGAAHRPHDHAGAVDGAADLASRGRAADRAVRPRGRRERQVSSSFACRHWRGGRLTLGATPDIPVVLIGMLLTGIGVGLTIPTLMGVGLGAVPPSAFATGSGVINMVRQAFMAVGVAVLVAILGTPSSSAARMASFHVGWWVLCAIVLSGLIPTRLLPRGRPVPVVPAEARAPAE